MRFLAYILTYSILWLLSVLPERVVYFISDGIFFVIYYLVHYRKSVVFENISRAFPDYSDAEVKQTAKKFYHHFCDMMLESSITLLHSKKKVMKKISYKNPEILHELHKKGKQIVAVMGHYGNWEYLTSLPLICDYKFVPAYKPLKNRYFNRLVLKNRQKFGGVAVPMENIARKLFTFKQENTLALGLFLSDQRPLWSHIQYWTKFMGMDTPVYLGTEKLSKKLDAAVVFLKIRKLIRGHYQVEFELITENPAASEPYEITNAHVKILEDLIREEPCYWLWSHRRWKHSYERFQEEHQSKINHHTAG